jgi:hypothetical protein
MISGKGMYTWIIERCGEPTDMVQQALQAGCNYLFVKLADGSYPYYGRNYYSKSTRDFTMELVEALKGSGIDIVPWQYVYGANPILEAEVIVERMQTAGLKKLVVNAEVEYKASGMGVKAVRYCQRLLALIPDIQLGLSTYRFPTYHQGFPWTEFGQFMDCYLPQVYWIGAHNPVEQLGRCLREYSQLPYPNIPIYPTGAAYKQGSWQPFPGEITAFMTAVKDLYTLSAVNFWEWYNSKVYVPITWTEFTNFAWENQSPPPEPTTDFMMECIVDNLNIRTGPGTTYGVVGQFHRGDEAALMDIGGTNAWMQIKKGVYAGKWCAVQTSMRYMNPK